MTTNYFQSEAKMKYVIQIEIAPLMRVFNLIRKDRVKLDDISALIKECSLFVAGLLKISIDRMLEEMAFLKIFSCIQ